MKISKSTAALTGLGALTIMIVFGSANGTATEHHRSIMADVHANTHGHVHWGENEKDKASKDQWALKEMLKQHQGSKGAAEDVARHMHKPIETQ